MQRAIFLDRDGVLNRAIVRAGKPYPPGDLSELEILPGVEEACQRLRQAGFLLMVVTNQPDVSRGSQRREVVEAINQALQKALSVDDIWVCYHDDNDKCACRKPAPGLLQAAATKWQIELPHSFMVGDRGKDIEAGYRAGCKTVLINNTYIEAETTKPDYRADSLAAATDWLIGQISNNKEIR